MKQLYRVVATKKDTDRKSIVALNCDLDTAERIKAAHEEGKQAEIFTYSVEPQDARISMPYS